MKGRKSLTMKALVNRSKELRAQRKIGLGLDFGSMSEGELFAIMVKGLEVAVRLAPASSEIMDASDALEELRKRRGPK